MSLWSADSHLDRFLIGFWIVLGVVVAAMGIYETVQHPEPVLRGVVTIAVVALGIAGFSVFAWVAGTVYFRIRGDSE